MKTLKYFLTSYLLTLIFSFSSLAQTAQQEQPFIFSDEFNNAQELIIGFDPYGTDGLDPNLGEEFVAQAPPGEFGARFQLPTDTSITTIKDIRYGCGQPFYYEHLIDLSYSNGSTTIDVNWDWIWPTWFIKFINPFNGNVLATYESFFDSTHFIVPTSLNKIKITVQYDGPLSWPEYKLFSPDGGEILHAGDTYNITWWNNELEPFMNIEFSADAGKSWNYIVQNLSTSQNSYNWLLPQIDSQHSIIRIGNYPCAFSQSSGTFVIYENNPPQLNPVEIPFWVIDAIGDSVNLIVGMHPSATNGIDTLLGEIEIPLPDPGTFAAAMILDDSSVTLKDLQPGYNSYIGYKGYKFNVQPTLDSIVYFNMLVPEGAIVGLLHWQKLQNGYRFIDTTFISQEVNYQFPPNSYYGGFFDSKGIIVRIYFDGTIPVELTSFTASAAGNDVYLNWSTATELNNYGFNIEKRQTSNVKQNRSWKEISFVPGHGTTTELQQYSFIDESVSSGKYQYRLKQIDYDGTFEYSDIIEVEVGLPTEYSLEQNYPNPFNPSTIIRYSIPFVETGHAPSVQIIVYDVLGNEVATLVNENQSPGNYEVEFNAAELSSGIYFYKLSAGAQVKTKKMILLK